MSKLNREQLYKFLKESLTNKIVSTSKQSLDNEVDKIFSPLSEWAKGLVKGLDDDEETWIYEGNSTPIGVRCDYSSDFLDEEKLEYFLKNAPESVKDDVIRYLYDAEKPHDYPGGIPGAFLKAVLNCLATDKETKQILNNHLDGYYFIPKPKQK